MDRETFKEYIRYHQGDHSMAHWTKSIRKQQELKDTKKYCYDLSSAKSCLARITNLMTTVEIMVPMRIECPEK